jgi:hypothetical protein
VPSKTFHFEANFEKVLEDLIQAYVHVGALVELLRGILADAGQDTEWAHAIVADCDRAVVAAIRKRHRAARLVGESPCMCGAVHLSPRP